MTSDDLQYESLPVAWPGPMFDVTKPFTQGSKPEFVIQNEIVYFNTGRHHIPILRVVADADIEADLAQ